MCSCDPPLAHERETVLDSYFDAVAAERPAGGGGNLISAIVRAIPGSPASPTDLIRSAPR